MSDLIALKRFRGLFVCILLCLSFIRGLRELSGLAMAPRRALWSRAVVVESPEDGSGIRHEGDENVNPLLGFEHESVVRERHVLVGCSARLHPRIPLLDISHLFPVNVSSLDNQANMSPPVQQAQGNRRVRRPLPSTLSQTSRKRRQPGPTSEAPAVRRVLPKFR